MNPHLYWLSQYRRYLKAMEGFIAHMDESLPLTGTQRKELRENPVLELEYDVGVEDLEDAIEVFPSVLRRSAFLLLFTLLESTLDGLAEEGQQRSKNPINVSDLRGNGFTRVVHYLALVTPIDLRELSEWAEIQRFQRLRNALIHRNGQLKAADDILSWVRSSQHLTLEMGRNGPLVQLENGFCEHAATVVENALFQIPIEAWPENPQAAT